MKLVTLFSNSRPTVNHICLNNVLYLFSIDSPILKHDMTGVQNMWKTVKLIMEIYHPNVSRMLMKYIKFKGILYSEKQSRMLHRLICLNLKCCRYIIFCLHYFLLPNLCTGMTVCIFVFLAMYLKLLYFPPV